MTITIKSNAPSTDLEPDREVEANGEAIGKVRHVNSDGATRYQFVFWCGSLAMYGYGETPAFAVADAATSGLAEATKSYERCQAVAALITDAANTGATI